MSVCVDLVLVIDGLCLWDELKFWVLVGLFLF